MTMDKWLSMGMVVGKALEASMANLQSSAARAHAAVVAASNALVSKRAYTRGPWPGGLPDRLRAPTPSDVPGLLADSLNSKDTELRVSRLTAASLLHSLDKDLDGRARPLLVEDERTSIETRLGETHKSLENLLGDSGERRRTEKHSDKPKPPQKDRRCYYCGVFSSALEGAFPFAVVNHSAHVVPSFDISTNIAGAEITNYQLLVPKDIALMTLARAHPLNWASAVPTLWQASYPVVPDKASKSTKHPGYAKVPPELPSGKVMPLDSPELGKWTKPNGGRDHNLFLYEVATWPWNDQICTEFRNIIAVQFTNGAPAVSDSKASLYYDYRLGDCIESNLGVGFEYGGLDVDCGYYDGYACPLSKVESRQLENLTLRDIAHWRANAWSVKDLRAPGGEDFANAKRSALDEWAKALQQEWIAQPRPSDEEQWLLTISAKKSLRYTAPGDTPLELWAALTWMAPAMLFAFINRGVCQQHIY